MVKASTQTKIQQDLDFRECGKERWHWEVNFILSVNQKLVAELQQYYLVEVKVMIHLLLVDDQIIIRQGIKSLLESKPDFQIVGEAENGEKAIIQVETLKPDVVLMDIRMPVMDGVAATQAICQRFPDVKVLVLTTFDDDEYVSQAMQFGARGYLLKDTPIEPLANAIRSVYQGYTQLGPGLFEKVLPLVPNTTIPQIPTPFPWFTELTPREKEVLRLIAVGASNRDRK